MSPYYLPWVLLIVASLWVSLVGFFWALKRGQFSEQERARYLPLRGELGFPHAKTVRRLPKEVYAMLLVVALVGSSLLAVIATIALRARGGG